MRRNRWVAAVLTTLTLLMLPAGASAINYGGVGAKPANPRPDNPRTQSIFIYELKPGGQASDAIKVQNNTQDSQDISLYAVDSIVSSDGSFGCAQNADPRKEVGSWIQLSQDSVTLAPNSTMTVPFTIAVPADRSVSVGEHDGCIAIQTAAQTAKPSNQSGVLLSFRTATRVVVTVPGKIVKKLTVNKVAVTHPGNKKLTISPTITNAGNVSLDTNLRTKLLSVFGVSATTAQNGTTPILPHDSASRNFEVPRPFWGGFYRAQVLATYNANPAARLGASSKADEQTVSSTSGWFFAAPAPAALLIELAILLLLAGVVYRFVTGRRRHTDVANNWEDYKVKARDKLPALAESRGVAWREVARANRLKAPYHLEKGQTIKLPPKPKQE
jgi:hypothetical protein